jgi:hypothetical protein
MLGDCVGTKNVSLSLLVGRSLKELELELISKDKTYQTEWKLVSRKMVLDVNLFARKFGRNQHLLGAEAVRISVNSLKWKI